MAAREIDWVNDAGVQAVIEVIARKVTESVIAEHIASCPHGQKFALRWAWIMGLCMGSGIAGGGIGMAITRALMGFQ